jgi:hypothetical protein
MGTGGHDERQSKNSQLAAQRKWSKRSDDTSLRPTETKRVGSL